MTTDCGLPVRTDATRGAMSTDDGVLNPKGHPKPSGSPLAASGKESGVFATGARVDTR